MAQTGTTMSSAQDIGIARLANEDLELSQFRFNYNDLSDTVYVHFYGKPLPAVSVWIDEGLYLLVGVPDERLVGLQFEYFLASVVQKHPEWLPLGELAGIPAEAIEKARAAIDIDRRRAAVVMPILKQLQLLAS